MDYGEILTWLPPVSCRFGEPQSPTSNLIAHA